MVVGLLRLDLAVFGSTSLKDKRRAIRSLKDRLTGKFNVSVAEVDSLDSHQHAVLGVALVANDSTFVHQCLDKILDVVRMDREANLVRSQKRVESGGLDD
jgi:hypothetical protein